ncbi:MAG: acyl-CoA dehydrogenase family protein [Pseudomonadota bacterium]|nr:acyl-CoA dehydrogenase family protein [Pseudomonadota bacterium]
MINSITKHADTSQYQSFSKMIETSITDFIEKFVANQAKVIEKNAISKDMWESLGTFGLLGISAPESFGGLAQPYRLQASVIEQISRYSPSLGLSYLAHSHLCMNPLIQHGTEYQKKQWLHDLISGKKIGSIGISEPNAGSDALAMKTTATIEKDHFSLNGQKIWITNGPDADVCIVYAKTNTDNNQRGITAFIVDLTKPGVKKSKPIEKLGMRGSKTGSLYFSNVRLSKEDVIGEIDSGLSILMQGLNIERVMLAAGPLGIQKACLDLVLDYTSHREQFNKPLIEFQITQAKIADMYTGIESSQTFLTEAFNRIEQNQLTNAYAASVYLHCSRTAVATSMETVQLLGGNGYTEDYAAEMLMRDAKLFDIGGGTNEIRQMIIAKEIIKAFRKNN